MLIAQVWLNLLKVFFTVCSIDDIKLIGNWNNLAIVAQMSIQLAGA